ncbi:MAG: hypothetical protein RR504_05030 [Christensenellaceae bacterium]
MGYLKDELSNVMIYEPKEYLSKDDFLEVKDKVYDIWHKSAWVHLRMTNDINTKNPLPLPKPEIKRRLLDAKNLIDEIFDIYLKEE